MSDEKPVRRLDDLDLNNIEAAAKERFFSHWTDTLRLVTEIRNLRKRIDDLKSGEEPLAW